MDCMFFYKHDDKTYQVNVTSKRVRSIRYRYRNGMFYVTAPRLTKMSTIVQGIDKFYNRLTIENPHCSGQTDEYVYLLGKRIALQSEGKINLTDGGVLIYNDKEELDKKLRKWFLNYITYRHRQYEKTMKTGVNKVRVRKMYTRYGSNSVGKKSITYSTILMHYSPDVIDSVIVHELAHCFVLGHDEKFYKIVRKYCPNYDYLHKRLRKGIYSDD